MLYLNQDKGKETTTMKKRSTTPKYTIHHLGTEDIYSANTKEELEAILAILGEEADIYEH